ncbi:hypothetical protein ADH70_009345 [Blautia pseudococcoides]|uniref:Uncharacterized protein n=1 Tax=Blautia pseudococcoides TaxID=1796616 RepID=A0A1C7I995_9FIRM|nr:hypothetical protein A4V09_10890 [Blautia pseudococcoides]ASU29035.1 hypothetical protein ADH70_009345 [Blautia pseudococcoides]
MATVPIATILRDVIMHPAGKFVGLPARHEADFHVCASRSLLLRTVTQYFMQWTMIADHAGIPFLFDCFLQKKMYHIFK